MMGMLEMMHESGHEWRNALLLGLLWDLEALWWEGEGEAVRLIDLSCDELRARNLSFACSKGGRHIQGWAGR